MTYTEEDPGLDSGLGSLVNAVIRVKQAFDPDTPANTGTALKPAVTPAAVPWYQRPLVLVAAVLAVVLAVVLVNRK